MIRLIYMVLLFTALIVSCQKNKQHQTKKSTPYERFYSLEIPEKDTPLNIKKKRKVPFFFNTLIDPFAVNHNSTGISKSAFYAKPGGKPYVLLLSDFEQRMNVSAREKNFDSVAAYPVIIENRDTLDTLYLKVFKGKALITQEAKNKFGKWKNIERNTTEKLGYYYYKIYPNQYVYTRIPVYDGKIQTVIRAKVIINDSITLTTPEYKGGVNRQQLR